MRAAGASPACPLPWVFHTAKGEWEHRGFPACRAFRVLKAEAGGSQPGAPFSCCPAKRLASELKECWRGQKTQKARLWIPASAVVPDILLPYRAVVSSSAKRIERCCPISWLGRVLKNLGHGSSLGFRLPQAESGGDDSVISTSLLLFRSPPFPAPSPSQRSTWEALGNQQPKVLWEWRHGACPTPPQPGKFPTCCLRAAAIVWGKSWMAQSPEMLLE